MQQPEDIVRDILDRLHEAFAAGKPIQDAEFWGQIERDIRRDWGGAATYIPKTTADARRYISARDAAIVRDYRRGEHSRLLARRYGISARRIRQIVTAHAETV
jgi:Mor family transcriptional regulator